MDTFYLKLQQTKDRGSKRGYNNMKTQKVMVK